MYVFIAYNGLTEYRRSRKSQDLLQEMFCSYREAVFSIKDFVKETK